MPLPGNRNNTAAIALIVIGALIALSRIFPSGGEITAGMILLTISSAFLFFSFWKHIYGLLIPGAILAGLGLGIPFAGSDQRRIGALGPGARLYLNLSLLVRALFNQHSPWPMFPAIPLFCVGAIIAIASLPSLLAGGMLWVPLLLIGAGLYLGWGRRTA